MIEYINALLYNKILNKKNLSNIKFSGLKGQALVIDDKDIPSIKEFQDVIPDHYFKCNTKTSLRYLLQSVLIQSLVVAIGLSIPFTPKMIPIWIIYAFLSGTTAMGFWVIAHECGHGAFSKNKTLESITGYLLPVIDSNVLFLENAPCPHSWAITQNPIAVVPEINA